MANIPEGFGIIAGRGKANAQKAIAAAIAAKVDPVAVRTVAEGYLVPEKVLVEFEKANKAESEATPPKRERKARTQKSAEKPAEKPEEASAESESDKKED